MVGALQEPTSTLTAGQADVASGCASATVRLLSECWVARGVADIPAAGGCGVDLDRLQDLRSQVEAHKRAEASSAVNRRLLVVSVTELDPRADAQGEAPAQSAVAEGLLAEAEEAIRKAYLALPINLPALRLHRKRAPRKHWMFWR